MFRKKFPRLYELGDQVEESGSYFHDFDNFLQTESLLQTDSPVLKVYRAKEKLLQGLDSASWDFFKKEARPYLIKRDKTNGRGWQQLSDIINQAGAYNFLKTIGCSSIHFIPQSRNKGIETPDLQGIIDSVKVLCEVKTINISDEEAQARCGDITREIKAQLEQGFFNKLMSDLTKAEKQLKAYDTDKEARHLAYIIINFDDFLTRNKESYFQQIDQYLSENTAPGIDVVFHNQATCFHKTITMKYATVFNE